MKPILRAALITAVFVASGAARADVFKCSDPVTGRVTYTNAKTSEKGCTLLTKEQNVTTVPAIAPRKATPADFPRVDSDTQRSRDTDRRKILESELDSETQALAEAKKALAEQESIRTGDERNFARVLERLKPFQEQVDLHERNIDAIKTEIGRLK